MSKRTSKSVFFWTLVCLFFITASVVIFYAFGYRFSFNRGVFVFGGSITLKTTPQQASVYINGQPVASQVNRINSSYHVGGIAPGEYNVEVSAPGFKPWSKRVPVHSGVSTEYWNILLVQNSYEKEDYAIENVGRYFISPRKNLVAVTQQKDRDFSVYVLDPKALTTDRVFLADDHTFTDDKDENIEWAPQAHRIIIPAMRNDGSGKDYFIVDVSTQDTLNLQDVAHLDNISHVRWDPKNKNVVFFMSNDNLYRIDLDAPDTVTEAAQHIASYDVSSDGLFYFQMPSGIIYQKSLDGGDNPTQVTMSPPSDMSDPAYRIIVYDADRITMRNRSNNLYVFNRGEKEDYFQQLLPNALGSQFSDDGKKLLYWNDREIYVYFVRKWETQPQHDENEISPITRFSDPVFGVQWIRDYSHVLFVSNKTAKIIELDNRDKRNMEDVLSINMDNPDMIGNFSDSKLYFTENNTDDSLSLHSIIFPEKPTIFGFGG